MLRNEAKKLILEAYDTTFPGGTTVARFKDYLENDLIPYVRKLRGHR